MVQSTVYLAFFALSITSFSLNLSALLKPTWITFSTPSSSPIQLETNYGLFQRCSTTTLPFDRQPSTTCRAFPTRSLDCSTDEGRFAGIGWNQVVGQESMPQSSGGRIEAEQARKRLGRERENDDDEPSWSFCDSWITAGYLTQLALLLSATSSLSSLLILASSSRQKRQQGWRLPVLLSTSHAVLLIVAFSLVVHEFQTRQRFYLGCRLDSAFVMATTSWCLSVVAVAGLVGAGLGAYGAEQDGYAVIGDGE